MGIMQSNLYSSDWSTGWSCSATRSKLVISGGRLHCVPLDSSTRNYLQTEEKFCTLTSHDFR